MASKRTGLGRGIGALIPGSDSPGSERPVDVFFPNQAQDPAVDLVAVPGATLRQLKPSDITPNPQQPRSHFDPDDLNELIHSVREFGVLQPIVVRPKVGEAGKFELIMGERRWRASQAAGLETIPAVVRDTADADLLRDALLENLHRSQLNPLEEASAYQQLLADFGITQDQLAERIGRSRPQISNTIRLLRLPEAVQLRVAAGVLSAGHARAILSLGDDLQAMQALADKIVNEDLSVRSAEAAAAKVSVRVKSKRIVAGARQSFLSDAAARLGDRLDTRASISLGARTGTLTIEFASVQDLKRILSELGVADVLDEA